MLKTPKEKQLNDLPYSQRRLSYAHPKRQGGLPHPLLLPSPHLHHGHERVDSAVEVGSAVQRSAGLHLPSQLAIHDRAIFLGTARGNSSLAMGIGHLLQVQLLTRV